MRKKMDLMINPEIEVMAGRGVFSHALKVKR